MRKKNKRSAIPPLADYWTASGMPSEIIAGEPRACVAATYEFDADFYESELLPRFLGLTFDRTENESTFRVEREEALALVHAAVLVDRRRIDPGQTTLRWDQLPIRIPGGIQHAKLSILAWEHLVRVIIGSANVTRAGYRRNREMFAVLDFWDDPASTPTSVLRESLDLMQLMLNRAEASPVTTQRTDEVLQGLKRQSSQWTNAPRDFTPRQRPRAAIVATHPRLDSQPARSALGELLEFWGRRRASVVTVVTPFVAVDSDQRAGDPVVQALSQLPMTRDCEGWLVAPELPQDDRDRQVRLPFPASFGTSWKDLFAKRGGSYVLALPLCVAKVDTVNRPLHSKCLVFESEPDDTTAMMIGSSNFTPRGMGLGTHNFEINLVVEDSGSAKRDGVLLADRLALPLGWDHGIEIDEASWQGVDELPEDQPDDAPLCPEFFAWANYSQKSGVLSLHLNRSAPEPFHWSISLDSVRGEVLVLFSSDQERSNAQDPAVDLAYTLPENLRATHIVTVTVAWRDEQGEQLQAKLGVTIEGAEQFLPPEELGTLAAETIIECLISGKSPSQWFDQQSARRERASRDPIAVESLRCVDTSSLLMYRVRRFGQALSAMSARIADTPPLSRAIRYRLLQDPFGPLSLAKSLLPSESDATEAIVIGEDQNHEHIAFLLAEILLTVVHLRAVCVKRARGKEREVIVELFAQSTLQLHDFIEHVTRQRELPANLREYMDQVRSLAGTLSAKESVAHSQEATDVT